MLLHFNAHYAKLFVAATLYPSAHETVLVDRKDCNISDLKKGETVEILNYALSKSDAFKVTCEK